MAGGKHLTGHRALQEPFQGLVAGTPEVSSDASPVQVHVHSQGCGCGVIGEAALLLTDLGHAHASQFFWYVHMEVTGLAQLLKILSEKAVLPVVDRCTLSTPGQDVVRQDALLSGNCHMCPPWCNRRCWPYRAGNIYDRAGPAHPQD